MILLFFTEILLFFLFLFFFHWIPVELHLADFIILLPFIVVDFAYYSITLPTLKSAKPREPRVKKWKTNPIGEVINKKKKKGKEKKRREAKP